MHARESVYLYLDMFWTVLLRENHIIQQSMHVYIKNKQYIISLGHTLTNIRLGNKRKQKGNRKTGHPTYRNIEIPQESILRIHAYTCVTMVAINICDPLLDENTILLLVLALLLGGV
jgi:hypothetical protein